MIELAPAAPPTTAGLPEDRVRSGRRARRSRKITLAQLQEAGACTVQLRLFERLYGQEVTVTVGKALRVAQQFSWGWARCLLSEGARDAYDAAQWLAWTAYDAARAQAQTAYAAATEPAQDAYDAACAQAWAEAYINDEGTD